MNKCKNYISIENFDASEYSLQLSQFLDKIHNDYSIEYSRVVQQVAKKWQCDLYDIFDKVTGGVFVRDNECYLLNSSLSVLFFEKEDSGLIYSCPLDNGILLRGPHVYYYLICFKAKYQNPTVDNVIIWWNNIKNFLCKLKNAIKKDEKIEFTERQTKIQTKYIMGCLDNLRSFTLICLNSEAILISDEKCNFITIKDNKFLQKNVETLNDIHGLLNSLLFMKCSIVDIYSDLLQIIWNVEKNVDEVFGKLVELSDENTNGRCLKLHREVDSYIENYVTLNYAYGQIEEELRDKNTNIYLCGILNGAVEIVVMMQKIAQKYDLESAYLVVPGDYLSRHRENTCILWNDKEQEKSAYLVDDNVMTGSTIKTAMKYMNEQINCSIKKCILIRHPDINRIPQMEAYQEAVSVDFLEKYCVGLLNESPYSKIKPNTNIGGEYLDELGIFTLTGDYFLRFLYKNGIYGENSEVESLKKIYNLYEVR